MIFIIKSKEEKSIDKIYQKVMKEYEKFFEFKWNNQRPKIFRLSAKNYLQLTEGLLRKSATAFSKGDYIFLQDKYFKDKKEIERILRHELAHAFTYCIANSKKYKPCWLWEGIAVYISGENKNKTNNLFNKFLKYYNFIDSNAYSESGFVVQFLVENYGKKKLVELIKSLKNINSEEVFSKKFKEIYKFELSYNQLNKQFSNKK
jgi:hypothetical protein